MLETRFSRFDGPRAGGAGRGAEKGSARERMVGVGGGRVMLRPFRDRESRLSCGGGGELHPSTWRHASSSSDSGERVQLRQPNEEQQTAHTDDAAEDRDTHHGASWSHQRSHSESAKRHPDCQLWRNRRYAQGDERLR